MTMRDQIAAIIDLNLPDDYDGGIQAAAQADYTRRILEALA